MIQAPNTYTVKQVVDMAERGPMRQIAPNHWVTVRPMGFSGLVLAIRLKAAWRVFTGKSDELTWDENGKPPTASQPPVTERTARTRATDVAQQPVYHEGIWG